MNKPPRGRGSARPLRCVGDSAASVSGACAPVAMPFDRLDSVAARFPCRGRPRFRLAFRHPSRRLPPEERVMLVTVRTFAAALIALVVLAASTPLPAAAITVDLVVGREDVAADRQVYEDLSPLPG